MSTKTVTIADVHYQPGSTDTCELEITVDVAYEPPDPHYGADADGNRGIYVPGYTYTDDEAPVECKQCGHLFTDRERLSIQGRMERAAEEFGEKDDGGDPRDTLDDL